MGGLPAASVLVVLCMTLAVAVGSMDSIADMSWVAGKSTATACNGAIGECFAEEEGLMDSEFSRRILASTRTYISYGSLRADGVPCSQLGASYYNCKDGAKANPYTRACTQITRCARDTS
eukprot:Gb_24936 [translate_table: standard]